MTRSLEQDVDFVLVDGPGYTDVEAYELLAGIGRNTSTLPMPLTAAANEGHTGAMIALVPSDDDTRRLKVRDGEARDQLHLTLLYLGEADAIDDAARQKIIDGVTRLADATSPITAQGFSINAFNPAGDEPCLVLGVGNGGPELEDVHRSVNSIVRGIGVTYPENHTPWVPHVTLQYTDDLGQIARLAKKTGPITFDYIRVAFAGNVTDIPLGGAPLVAHASHDQNAHGNWARKAGIEPIAKPKGPLSKEQLSKHVNRVREGIAHALKSGLDTKLTYRPNGVWTVERDKIHREIVDDVYKRAAKVPNDGKAILSGGPAGAGKSTALGKLVDQGDYLVINPDSMKEELARRKLIPEIPGFEDLSPMERSTLVHQESRRLAAMLAERAKHDRKNVIYDTTMTSYSDTKNLIQELDKSGYSKISGVFVDVPYDVSIARTRARYAAEVNDYLAGNGEGGRFLPTSAVNAHFDYSGKSYAAGTFKSLRNMFDAYVDFDNSGAKPKLRDEKGDVS